MNWGAIGRAIGKGVVWLLRHPEALQGVVAVVDQAREAAATSKTPKTPTPVAPPPPGT